VTTQRIIELVQLLPQESSYYSIDSGFGADGKPAFFQDQRMQRCVRDQRFGWNFVMAFVEVGIPLPAEVIEKPLLLLYDFSHGSLTMDFARVQSIEFAANVCRRNLLRASLLTPQVSLEQISRMFHLSVEAIAGYETLFFNCRDRMENTAYVTQLIWSTILEMPAGPRSIMEPDLQALFGLAKQRGIALPEFIPGLFSAASGVGFAA